MANLRKLPQIDELKKLYFGEGLSFKDIADRFSVTLGAVALQFRHHGVKPRARGYDPVHKEYPDWTDPTTKQILLGSLLGDGGLFIQGTHKKTIQYLEGHCMEQKEYLLWKNKYLKFHYYEYIGKDHCIKGRLIKGRTKSCLSSRWHPELDKLYAKYYKDGKKNVEAILEDMDDVGMLVWYLDDGQYSPIPIQVFFATLSYNKNEHSHISKWFEKRNISVTIQKIRMHKNDEKTYFQTRSYGDNARKIREIVEKEMIHLQVPVCMRYKIRKKKKKV